MEKQKAALPKVKRDKKKTAETGLLIGQNTNIFSQLSATYLQKKVSATEEEANFANSTQIVEYHDPNVNRLIALLRKKADVTKAKAAVELKQQILKMNEENVEEFASTFAHLFMEVVINEQSKQVIEQFVFLMSHLLTNFKKIMIKQIATIFGPLFVIHRSNNMSQTKIYTQLFNGTEEQLHEKAITLLVSKSVMKKFLVFCRVIVECEEVHKIGQQNFQRNCASLLKVIKQFIRSYDAIVNPKQQVQTSFANFIREIDEIVQGKFALQYFKVGGKAKSTFLQFYQALVSATVRHPQWEISWETHAKALCQNYLDKDATVQHSLWKYCNKQFVESIVSLGQREAEGKEKQQQGKNKDKYWLLLKYLPKPEEKLLSCIKVGGQTMYRELPAYCGVFPYTVFEDVESHKAGINKIGFIRKIMQSLLEMEDQNEARIECYYLLSLYFVKILRNMDKSMAELDEKKQQELKSLALKAQKQMVNNLQERYYKNPPTSRNSFTYSLPAYFCKLLEQAQPTFDFCFDEKQTFSLYNSLTNGKNSEYSQTIYDKVFEHCNKNPALLVLYLQNFPARQVGVDMSESNNLVEEASKIFILSTAARNPQNWFAAHWDIKKKLIVFDPRISSKDFEAMQQYHSSQQYYFKPSNRVPSDERYLLAEHDQTRFDFFLACLKDSQLVNLIPMMLPMVRDYILNREIDSTVHFVGRLLAIHRESCGMLKKKQWVVSQVEVLRVRVVFELVCDTLRTLSTQKKEELLSGEVLEEFLGSSCIFVLTIFNYKLESEAEELLKLLTKLTAFQKYGNLLLDSARQSIKQAYLVFSKFYVKQGQDKQRKNRLNRLLGFIRKIQWYAINKKKAASYITLFEDQLQNPDWRHAEYRPQLWLILETLLEVIDEDTKKAIASKILQKSKQATKFLTLLLCCQLILALQRHPSARKLAIQLQSEVLRQLKQRDHAEILNIIQAMIAEVNKDSSYLIVFGVRNTLKVLMKNYQQLKPEVLQKYSQVCIEETVLMAASVHESSFTKVCILAINLMAQLPLLDLPNMQALCEKLHKMVETETDDVKVLGYFAISSCLWDSSIGSEHLGGQKAQGITKKLVQSLKTAINHDKVEQTNFVRFAGLTCLNSLLQLKSKQIFAENWDFIVNEVAWRPVQQGSLLHGALQSARFKFISKIFSSASPQMQSQIVDTIPSQIAKQINFYKQILDQIEDQQNEEQTSETHYQNIINMFIQFAEVLVRIAGGLGKQLRPNQQVVLQLLQCPFAGIKKTAYMLLKQMYELNLVQRLPSYKFLTYLKLDQELTRAHIDPLVANTISSYLYSWQAIIERKPTIERVSGQQQSSISLEDYLQNEQLYEPLLKCIFQILDNQLEYLQNQQQYQITAEELLELDTVVAVEDDTNLHAKMFRLTVKTLFMFVRNFPLFLRYFMDKNKKYRNVCERLLRNVVSDAIFKEQVSRIEVTEPEWKAAGNFEIYVTPKNKEIYAEYTHDVIRIGLRLTMKSNFPLMPISIQFGQGLKIEDGSRWALMLQNQLHSRNNTIINGILLWKDNIDKKLAGVEQCAICFDIVNPQGQLPKKACKTCKKKFHSVCIMKWFSKSNKSECPLCKSQFL